MSMNNIKLQCFYIIFVSLAFHACSFQSDQEQDMNKNTTITENSSQDTSITVNGIFDIPELSIVPAPANENHFTFSLTEKVTDYDVSPTGLCVAAIVEKSENISIIKFWQIDRSEIMDSCDLPVGLKTKEIIWHPNAKTLFVMGVKDNNYQIFRVELLNGEWIYKSIFSCQNQLKNLLSCPRPFITSSDFQNGKEFYTYRIFFGMDNGDKTYRIVSITEKGNRLYQVVGPYETSSKAENFDASANPSSIVADWALPVAFHPAGHQLIWTAKRNDYFVASYDSRYWGESKSMNIAKEIKGTYTPTPNGLGLIHWQKQIKGIGVYLLSTKSEDIQIPDYEFISTPSTVPDGKGIVGLTFLNGYYTLNYVPITIPLADVLNAWMFADSTEEIDQFQMNFGLFRPNIDDQLYKLYESENYYCSGYSRTSPTRPYIVTTDIFWELFGAAYQGLFIVKERDEAIPNFWKFISKADSLLDNSKSDSPWRIVFSTLLDLDSGNVNNPEVDRILNEQDCFTDILNDTYTYSDLKPRGHYTSSKELENYFRAFRYFTTIYKHKQDTLNDLNLFPAEITAYAEKWITSYSGLISPSRSPLAWKNMKQIIPNYCQYPQEKLTVFPLSWGFDNEVFFSTVYQLKVPLDLRIKGPFGERILPTGLDLAAVLGNNFAEKLLESDYEKYPPLRKVIGNLKKNFNGNPNQSEFKENLYNQWISAIAVQWADSVNSTNGEMDKEIWQVKRLQTGLATWSTLRHATVLVNERTAAECGEGGFEEILMRAPRGYVEPDPYTFSVIAELFESAIKHISSTKADKSDIQESASSEKRSLYDGIIARLKEAAHEARGFQLIAEKERKGEMLSNEENEKILFVARTGEHLFLVFNSLSNKEYALSNPDPIAKITDVAGDGIISPFLMSAVGNAMEWNYIVPFYGRHQIVKGSIYSYYEFESNQLLNDKEWREKVTKQEFLPWITPYITDQKASGMANTSY